MKTPTIHLNGTSKEALLEQFTQAAAALRRALDLMIDASPNARDYYPQGDGAYQEARREFDQRVRKVHEVMREYEALAEAVA